MRLNTIQITALLMLVLTSVLPAQTASDGDKSFYKVEESVEQLKQEVQDLKDEVRRYQNRVNMPVIREEIRKTLDVPVLKYEIKMKNGTLIQGDIVDENMDRILFRTQIGELKLERSLIASIQEIRQAAPELSVKGAIEEQTYADKKIYSGTITNTGDKRADFVRIVFSLFQESTELVNADSAFVVGNEIQFPSGVYSMASIKPGETANFRCIVSTANKPVGYYTNTIHFSTFEK